MKTILDFDAGNRSMHAWSPYLQRDSPHPGCCHYGFDHDTEMLHNPLTEPEETMPRNVQQSPGANLFNTTVQARVVTKGGPGMQVGDHNSSHDNVRLPVVFGLPSRVARCDEFATLLGELTRSAFVLLHELGQFADGCLSSSSFP